MSNIVEHPVFGHNFTLFPQACLPHEHASVPMSQGLTREWAWEKRPPNRKKKTPKRRNIAFEVGFPLGLCGFTLLFAFDHRHCSLMRQRLPLFWLVWRRLASTRTLVRGSVNQLCAIFADEQDVYNHTSTTHLT